jgi:hypothetical protein
LAWGQASSDKAADGGGYHGQVATATVGIEMENPSSLLLPRRLARLVRQTGETTNKGQRLLELEKRGALAALQVLDAASPAGTFSRPLVPYAHDEGADG